MKRLFLILSLVVFLFGVSGCENTPVETIGHEGGDVVQNGGEELMSYFVVGLTLKSSFRHNYLLLEEPVIKALLAKYLNNGVDLHQSYHGAKNEELLRIYTLRARGNKETIIQDFLATGYFEDEYHESERVEICVVNDKSTWGF